MASCTKRILRAIRLSGFHMDCRTLVSGVEATNGFDDWGQCVRNYRIGGDGHALYTIHFVVIDFRLEGSPDITRNAAESDRSEEHTSELQSLRHLVCRLLLEKKTTGSTGRRRPRCGRVGARRATAVLFA